MKRNEAIAPLSRDHHHSLILAQLMKKDAPNYKGMPVYAADKALYAQEQFKNHIVRHFQQEETILEKVKHIHPSINALTEEIKRDHFELTELFHSLSNANDPEMIMNDLALKLENHIRREERILFPLLQTQCSETELAEIYELLH